MSSEKRHRSKSQLDPRTIPYDQVSLFIYPIIS